MKRLLCCISLAALMLNFAGCKEDEPSRIPTAPTSFGIEDGAVVEKTDVKLSASGSTTEMDDISISYEYYIGTSSEDLSATDVNVVLMPYTQYFWKAMAVNEYGESSESDVRTFYCVPPLDIETDNGDGEMAAVLRFKGLKNIKSGVVTATPNHEGYEMDPISIPEGQDSCYVKLKYYTAETSNAWVQNFDDEHGVLYEPVIYDFDVKLDVAVGDKTFSLNNTAKEIILDKQSCVRDHEFNVYRLVKIGSQTWLADDYRALSYYKNGKWVSLKEDEDYKIETSKSGASSVLYCMSNNLYVDDKALFIPQGFHISTDEDWVALEKCLGAEVQEPYYTSVAPMFYMQSEALWPEEPDYFFSYVKDYAYGNEVCLKSKLCSKYDWNDGEHNGYSSLLNIRPWGTGHSDKDNDKYDSRGDGACILSLINGRQLAYRVFSCRVEGIFRLDYNFLSYHVIRLVKD